MSSIMRDFVISLVTIGQSQVIVLNLEVHKWQDELKHKTQKQCISVPALKCSQHICMQLMAEQSCMCAAFM